LNDSRYARQIAVPGVGTSGQAAIARADVTVDGDDLAAEVCALYLAGAGVGTLRVPPTLAERCRRLSSDVRVVTSSPPIDARDQVAVSIGAGGERARFSPERSGDAVRDGSIAARWVLARVLSPRSGER
jgi:hypothetical protein